MNEEIKKLYGVLKSKGYYTNSLDEFQKKWQSDDYKRKVYGVVSRDGLYTKDYDSFVGKYGSVQPQVKKKDETIPSPSKPKAAQSVSVTDQTKQGDGRSASSGLLNQLSEASGTKKPITGTIFDGYEKQPIGKAKYSGVVEGDAYQREMDETGKSIKYKQGANGGWERETKVIAPTVTKEGGIVTSTEKEATIWQPVTNQDELRRLDEKFNKSDINSDEYKRFEKERSTLMSINSSLMSKNESDVVDYLNNSVFSDDFIFEQDDIFGNAIKVKTKDGLNEQSFYVGFGQGIEGSVYARKLRIFLEQNKRTSERIDFAEAVKSIGEGERSLRTDAASEKEAMLTEAERVMIENGIDPRTAGVAIRDVDMGLLPTYERVNADKLLEVSEKSQKDYKTMYTYMSGKVGKDMSEEQVKDELRASVGTYDEKVMYNFNKGMVYYLEDIRKTTEYASRRVNDLNSEAFEIKSNIASNGVMTEEQKVRLREIEMETSAMTDVLSEIDYDMKSLNDFEMDMAEAAGVIQLKKAEEGSFAGTVINGFIRGIYAAPRVLGFVDRDEIEELVAILGDEVATKEWANSEDRTMLEKAIFGVTESLGVVASSALTGPIAPLMATIGFYSMGYYEMVDQIDDDPTLSGISDSDKQVMGALYGMTSGILERFGIMKALNKSPFGKKLQPWIMKRVFSSIPKGATPDVVELAIKNDIKKLIASKAINIVGAGVVEFSTEAAQEMDKIVIQEVYDTVKGNDYFKNSAEDIQRRVLEAGVLGAIGGGVMSSVTQVANLGKESWKKNGVNEELAKMIQSLSGDANFKALQVNHLKAKILKGEITPQEAKDTMLSYNEMMSDLSKIPTDIKDVAAAYDLITEKQRLEREIEGKDKALSAPKIERIKVIDEELTNLTKQDAVQEQTTSEVPVQPEAEISGEMAEGAPEAEPKIATEEGKKVAKSDYAIAEVERVKSLPVENEDGATMNLDGSKYDGGGLVVPLASRNMAASELTPEAIDAFVDENSGSIGADNVKVGIYKFPNSDQVSIDINIVADRSMREEALAIGRELGQESLYDLDTGENVKTGADGMNPKSVTAEEFLSIQERLKKKDYSFQTVETAVEGKRANANEPRVSDVFEAVRTSLKASPNSKVVVHETRDAYLNAIANKTGRKRSDIEAEERANQTSGSYLTESGEVHIDASTATKQDVYHEVFHDVISKLGIKSETIAEMVKGLKQVVTDKALIAKIDRFTQAYEQGEVNEEFLTEIVADLANTASKLDTTRLQKLITLINRVASMIGLPQVLSNKATRTEVVNFVNKMADSLRGGREIEGVSGEVEVSVDTSSLSVKKRKIGSFEIQYFEDSKEFERLIEDGLVENNFDIGRISGEVVAVHQPDNMFVGTLKHKGKEIFTGNGGVFYTPNTGNVWASGSETAAKSLTNLINKSLKESSDGVGRLVLVRGTDSKMISSTEGVKAAMSIIELLVDSNLISRSEFRSSLIRAGKKFNIDFSGKDSSAAIHKDIKEKFMNVKNSSFQKRGDFFNELINDLSSTSSSVVDNIEAIRKELGSKRKISFSKDGIRDSIGEILTERLLSGLPVSHIYAIIEVTSPVEYKERKGHDSYPWVLVSKSKPSLKLLSDRKHAVKDGVLEMIDGSEVTQGKLGLAQRGMGIAKVSSGVGKASGLSSRKKRITEPVPGNKLFNEPLKEATDIAKSYMNSVGIEYVEVPRISKLDESLSTRISKAYDKMENNPSDPEVREAYEAMAKETLDQYEAITSQGYEVEINNSEPYSSSEDMIADLRENKRMKIFSTESGFGDEPITDAQREENILLRDSGKKDKNGQTLLVNDIFRFVHDFFGHAKLGNGFGPVGEENAWRVHSVMYSDTAVKAMTSETRGQNSWVNFSGVNKEAFKKRDKARELRRQGKIEEADAMVAEVYDEMKFADQKMGILPSFAWEQGAPSRKKRISPPERSEAINKAQEKYELSLKRGNSEPKAIEAAIADLQKNDWYKAATDIDREDAIRDLRKNLGLKQKSAPSAQRITGGKKPKTVSVNERTALREQIMLEARAAREASKFEKDVRKETADRIKVLLGKVKGKIPGQKITSIINKALKSNLSNPEMADRLADYALKLANDAKYDNKLTNANELQKAIKSALKSKDIQKNNVAMATAFKKIKPSMVDDIDTYIKNAQKVLSSLQKSQLKVDQVMYKVQAEVGDIMEYIQKQIEAQESVSIEMLKIKFPELFEDGYLLDTDSLREMMTKIENIETRKDKTLTEKQKTKIRSSVVSNIEYLETILLEMLNSGVDPISETEFAVDKETEALLRSLIKADKSVMDITELLKMVDILQNAIINSETGGVAEFVAIANGRSRAKKFEKEFGSTNKKVPFQSLVGSMTMIATTAMNGVNRGAKFMVESGLDKIRSQKTKAILKAKKITEDYLSKFEKTRPNGKKFDHIENVIERGMYAFLSRNVASNETEMMKEFERRLNLVRESVAILESDIADERMSYRAKHVRAVAEKLGVFDEGVTLDDIISRTDPKNIDAVSYWIDVWAENYDDLSRVASSVYNKELGSDMNYNPDVYKRIMNLSSKSITSRLEEFSGKGAFGIYDVESGSLQSATRPTKLPFDESLKSTYMYVDFDFDSNVSDAFADALIDINTAEAIREWEGFATSDAMSRIIPNTKTRTTLINKANEFIERTRGVDRTVADVGQAERVVLKISNATAKIGTSLLLGGVDQVFKQSISMMANTLVNGLYMSRNGVNAGGFIFYKDEKTGEKTFVNTMSIVNAWDKRYNEWLERGGVDVSLRGIESAGVISKAKTIGASEDRMSWLLDNLGSVSEMYVNAFLVNTDVAVAKAAFKTYYMKYLMENGKNPSVDLGAEMDQDAKAYALAMLAKQQGESDADMQSRMYTNNNAYFKSMIKLLMPLSSFVMNKKANMASDISILSSKTSTSEDKAIAAKSLLSSVIETATYTAVAVAIRALAYDTLASMITGYDPEDDDPTVNKLVEQEKRRRKALRLGEMTQEEEKAFRRSSWESIRFKKVAGEAVTNATRDLLSPGSVFDYYTLSLADDGIKYFQENYTSKSEIAEAIKEENKIRTAKRGGEKMDDVQEAEFIKGYLETKALRLSVFEDKGYGAFDFTNDKLKLLYDVQVTERTGTVKSDYGRGDQEQYLLPSDKKAAEMLAMLTAPSLIAPSDGMKIIDKSYRQLKKRAVSYTRYKLYGDIKDRYASEPKGLEDMIRSGMSENQIYTEIFKRTGVRPNR